LGGEEGLRRGVGVVPGVDHVSGPEGVEAGSEVFRRWNVSFRFRGRLKPGFGWTRGHRRRRAWSGLFRGLFMRRINARRGAGLDVNMVTFTIDIMTMHGI
jgi:hypothetical protein